MKKSLASLAILGVFSMVGSAHASPVLLGSFTFNCVTNNTGFCGNVAPQMKAELWGEAAGTTALFKIWNDSHYQTTPGYPSTITEVFFDNSFPASLGAFAGLTGSTGVSFAPVKKTPQHAPGYLGSGFQVYFDAAQEQGGSGITNGIDRGEWLGVDFTLESGVHAADLVSLIANDDLKIGLHVQSINGGTSDGMTTTGQVPEPASMLLLGTGLLGAGFAARRRKN